jgi:hypothetical protein
MCCQVRAALLCVPCDMPALRALCGFGGVGAYKGCNRCETVFTHVPSNSATGVKSNAGGFGACAPRTNTSVRADARCWEAATTEAWRSAWFKHTGVRWCELIRLPYFDLVKKVVVDPMHNLCSGSGLNLLHLLKTVPLRSTPLVRPGNKYEADHEYAYQSTHPSASLECLSCNCFSLYCCCRPQNRMRTPRAVAAQVAAARAVAAQVAAARAVAAQVAAARAVGALALAAAVQVAAARVVAAHTAALQNENGRPYLEMMCVAVSLLPLLSDTQTGITYICLLIDVGCSFLSPSLCSASAHLHCVRTP